MLLCLNSYRATTNMATANHVQAQSTPLHLCLFRTVHRELKYSIKANLPDLCDELGLPDACYEDTFTNWQYIQTRLNKIEDADDLREVAATFARRHPLGLGANHPTFEIEELLWGHGDREVPAWVRRELAARLVHADLCTDADAFLQTLGRLFVLDEEPSFAIFRNDPRSLLAKIREDFIENPKIWSVKELFRELGAFACTGERFCRLIEAFGGSQTRPTAASQRFVAAANSALTNTGFELVKTGGPDGPPVYSLKRLVDPKTIIFRFYVILENTILPAIFFFAGLLLLFVSLWISASISYFISKHHHAAGTVATLLITVYALFVYVMLKEMRWWWIVCAASSIVSLCITIYTGIMNPSRSLWMAHAACAITAFIRAFAQRGRETEPTEESIWEKLGTFFGVLPIASLVLAGCLFTVAEVLGIHWFLIEGLEFVHSPPYIKFVAPDWPVDN